MKYLLFSSFGLLLTLASGFGAERVDQPLPDQWKFIRDDVALTASTDTWQKVSIPHTWNTKSADASADKTDPHFKNGYYRGACWYERSLDIPADWKDKRVFIRFEAASLVSKAYLNGQLLGEHRGGFTAFCYELTPFLKFRGANELRVQVDNSHQADVAPLAGDFNVDGGIYRPVHLIVTDPVCISPLDMASLGVYETTKALTDADAKIEVRTVVSNGGTAAANRQVKVDIADADGKIIASQTTPASVEAGKTGDVITSLDVTSPHRWNGRKDPYLYTTTVSLLGANGTIDSVQQPLGLRTVEITEDKGFLLNGQPYPIHGVNRHQDWGDEGWAASAANMDQDAQIILDMGTTAIRLTHYPQSDHWHDLCDHNGLLLWNEVSQVGEVANTPEFRANAEQQMREMILQRYNHPSAAFWGLFNELKLSADDVISELQNLKSVAHELDPSRIIVAATNHNGRSFNQVPDRLCFNNYPGWYAPNIHGMPGKVESYSKEFDGKRVGISEYGAGSNAAQHLEGPMPEEKKKVNKGPFHPVEWQTHVHEEVWKDIKDNPKLWGTFIWGMFDFPSASRHEGSLPGMNDKGLVTQDRQIKKDAYYFYQANWSDKPMVRIASSSMTPRRLATTDVQVFSNGDKVELTVNGTSLGTVLPDEVRVFTWKNVALQPGKNEIKATATSSQGTIRDSCQWVLDPNAAPAAPVDNSPPSSEDKSPDPEGTN